MNSSTPRNTMVQNQQSNLPSETRRSKLVPFFPRVGSVGTLLGQAKFLDILSTRNSRLRYSVIGEYNIVNYRACKWPG